MDEISPTLHAHPDVLETRWQIYAKEKRWEACVDLGLAIMRGDPHRPFGWIHHSYALHELKKTELAYTHLATVTEKFPDDWHIPYNLACYCAQLGCLAEAKEWFKKAIALDDKIVPMQGIDDPDLKPLWESESGPIP